MMNFFSKYLWVFLVFSNLFAFSQDESLEWILFEVLPPVKIASKIEESTLSASGTVYVITDKEIERYGWRDMKEILAAIPNMDLLWHWNWLNGGQRGFNGNFSGTLLMIDGREVQNLLASEAFMKNNFPAHRIKRVEVLQGPNSTLYGGNATQGVINIVTKIGEEGDVELNETSISFGDGETYEMTGNFKKRSENTEFGFSASWFRSQQNWDELADFYGNDNLFSRQPDIDPFRYKGREDFQMPEENWTVDLFVRIKNVYFGANYFKAINIQGAEYVHIDYNINESRRGYFQPYIGYKSSINDNFNFLVEYQHVIEDENWLTYSEENKDSWTSYEDIQISFKGESFEETTRDRFIFQGDLKVGEKNQIIFGYDWWETQIDDYRVQEAKIWPTHSANNVPLGWPLEKSITEKHSVYVQDSIDVVEDKLKLNLGVRFNKQDHTNDSWLPRAIVVYMPTQDSAIKLSYSKAFRPPNIFEFNGTDDDEIDSQEVEMFELNYSQNLRFGELNFSNICSIYTMENTNLYNKVYDPIAAATSAGGHFAGWKTVVGGSYEVYGLEELIKFSYRHFSGFAGFRYIEPDKVNVGSESIVKDLPKYKFKMGLAYDFSKLIKGSLFFDHWGEVKTETVTVDGEGTEIYTIDPWSQVDLNLNIGPFVIDDTSTTVSLFVKNIFDEDVFHGNSRGTTPLQYMQYPRSLRIKASVKF